MKTPNTAKLLAALALALLLQCAAPPDVEANNNDIVASNCENVTRVANPAL